MGKAKQSSGLSALGGLAAFVGVVVAIAFNVGWLGSAAVVYAVGGIALGAGVLELFTGPDHKSGLENALVGTGVVLSVSLFWAGIGAVVVWIVVYAFLD